MNLQVVLCTHQTSELAIRERLAFSNREQQQSALNELRRRFPETEVVILSTCNRIEIYTASDDEAANSPTLANIAQFLAEFHDVPLDEFVGELRLRSDQQVVHHLFRVICSLESMVLGEPQIVTQVKEAYRVADECSACGPLTHALFQSAIRSSNRVRSETKLSEGRVSIASVAVGEFGKSIFDHFGDKQVLIIGAGEMAEETLRYLKDEGVKQIVVVNRNPERGQRLATAWNGQAAAWEELDDWLTKADVVISTTGADQPIVTEARFRQLLAKRHAFQPLFILDLGAPRDFEPSIAACEDVFLYDIDSLQATCERNRKARQKEIIKAEKIIEEEAERLLADAHTRASGSLITRLREDWHEISRQELERLFQRLPNLPAKDRDEVQKSVERIVNKLLHPPLSAIRDESQSGTPHGLLDALKRLFRLSD